MDPFNRQPLTLDQNKKEIERNELKVE